MAEGLLRHRLQDAGIPARVHSAGLVTEDRPASEHGVTAMARRGVDIAEHRSRRLALEMVRDADLILGMERQHVREVAVLAPEAFAKAFTIRDLARRAEVGGPRGGDESIAEWLRWVAAGRRPTDLLGIDPSDEVADPIGRPARDYERTAAQLEELVSVIVDHLFPQE
jgi:protein-tyrosine phosphatase